MDEVKQAMRAMTYLPRNHMLNVVIKSLGHSDQSDQMQEGISELIDACLSRAEKVQNKRDRKWYFKRFLPWYDKACHDIANQASQGAGYWLQGVQLDQGTVSDVALNICRFRLDEFEGQEPVPCRVRVSQAEKGPIVDIIPADPALCRLLGIVGPWEPEGSKGPGARGLGVE